MEKIVYILRGVPGCGKSSLAEELKTSSGIICCADDYFMKSGKYEWDATKIGIAHLKCKTKYDDALNSGVPVIVVANTNTTTRDVNFYRNMARIAGYTVFVLTVENWHDGKDEHAVPDEVKLKMSDQLKNTQKLFKMPMVTIDGKELPMYELNKKTGEYEKIKYW